MITNNVLSLFCWPSGSILFQVCIYMQSIQVCICIVCIILVLQVYLFFYVCLWKLDHSLTHSEVKDIIILIYQSDELASWRSPALTPGRLLLSFLTLALHSTFQHPKQKPTSMGARGHSTWRTHRRRKLSKSLVCTCVHTTCLSLRILHEKTKTTLRSGDDDASRWC